MLRLVEGVRDLLDEMASTITSERRIPREEIRHWKWSRLKRNYQAVQRASYDTFLLHEQAAEVGTYRAIQTAFGKSKPKPLPTADKVVKDIFAPQTGAADWIEAEISKAESAMAPHVKERWRKYMEANHLASWDDGGKGAHTVVLLPDETAEDMGFTMVDAA